MGKTKEYEPVVFENSEGEEVSNDPVWKAQRVLDEHKANQPEVEEHDDEDDDLDEGDDSPEDYKGFSGKAVGKLLADREGIDRANIKTVGQARAALIADDARLAAEAEVAAQQKQAAADTAKNTGTKK